MKIEWIWNENEIEFLYNPLIWLETDTDVPETNHVRAAHLSKLPGKNTELGSMTEKRCTFVI